MPNILDFTTSSAFNAIALSTAINDIPNMYGRVGKLNLFRSEGVPVRTVAVEIQGFDLRVLTSMPVGSPGQANTQGKRRIKTFAIPHFPVDDVVKAEDIQGVRAFGQDANALMGFAEAVNKKLMEIKGKHDITVEYMRVQALKGLIKDGAGNTILDVFSDFGVAQPTVAMDLGTATTDQIKKTNAILRQIDQSLTGDTRNGVMVLCSDSFYDKFITHATVKDAYKYFRNSNLGMSITLADDAREGFPFGNIVFVNYTSTVTLTDGTTEALIEADAAYAFPLGTNTSFIQYNAPADFIEAANTPGLPMYAKQERMEFDKGIKIHTQCNPLPLPIRPKVLVKLTA